MSFAPTSYTSLCSIQPLSRTTPLTKPNPSSLFSQIKHSSSNNYSFLSTSIIFTNTHLTKPSIFIVKASETESQTSKPESGSGGGQGQGQEPYEEYEVELEQPLGLKFAKGRDGGTYIDAIATGGTADKSGLFTVGDKVLATRFSWILAFFFFLSL